MGIGKSHMRDKYPTSIVLITSANNLCAAAMAQQRTHTVETSKMFSLQAGGLYCLPFTDRHAR